MIQLYYISLIIFKSLIILPLLGVLNPELGQKWPKYAANLIFEFYGDNEDDKYYIRILYNFEEIEFTNYSNNLIPYEDFPKFYIK